MENLNKQQIILLTLLVSFVTSIATGIVTVSLMDQAPQGVTQTINRVVERTIEKVVPTDMNPGQIVKETVVINEDDKVSEVIDKNRSGLVRIYGINQNGASTFFGVGVVIKKEGLIVGPNVILNDDSTDRIEAVISDGTRISLKKLLVDFNTKNAFYRVLPGKDGKITDKIIPSVMTDTPPKLGQSIVLIYGEKRDIVLTGIVSSNVPRSFTTIVASTTAFGVTEEKKNTYNFIDTNMNTANIAEGSPLFNLSGEVIGFKMVDEDLFVSPELIKTDLKILEANNATSTSR
jgi:S1-C subfamily serine protease